ncbi:MAG: serine--tRNA ligase [Thalassospira sp.]|uniref:Serine--tRNA ligase n=1 Tax=Thalassospira lohafexi TaxID=744227 RepID=A0A2N3L961_9PROT|nr:MULTISPECIES: serine--tRNA ligase [Thalassospira]MBV16652.1 serine--tRNA ligase [Thalassospira sp.]PKR59381.1 serine--tRNA ligase [Thalassospira lohafexi]|tara:strand:- start:57554 stop:58831 length:1278 start_codon:yes stop_codon:yes gene_type:complete
MHDIKWIRDNPEAFDAAMAVRKQEITAKRLMDIDVERRKLMTEHQEMLARRKTISGEIGKLRKNGEDADELMAEMGTLKDKIKDAEDGQASLNEQLDLLLSSFANILDPEVPVGDDEDDNVEVNRWGEPATFDFTPIEHFEIGEKLGMMDFETAAKLSGSRFVILRGGLAKLERALSQFMIDLHTTEHGYEETITPMLVRDDAMFGTGQLPKFAEDSFKTTNDYWLIPTSEVTLTNQVAGDIIEQAKLPLRFTALTQCFRSEAGSAGRDTRGMIRQHQFSKVEMVSVVEAEKSDEELTRKTRCAETVLERLGLPYRTVILCTGDIGFSACKTYDIEVWLPGQGKYREISSCSNTRDFQARRMNARYRAAGDKKTNFVHTLNGSGLAVGRCLIAVMENYQQADGSIRVPDALKPYMGGLEVISPRG